MLKRPRPSATRPLSGLKRALLSDRCSSAAIEVSLRLNAGRSNDFTPFRALLGDEGSKLGWGVPLRHDAERHEPLGGFRPFEIRGQRGVELIDDRLRCAGTGEK